MKETATRNPLIRVFFLCALVCILMSANTVFAETVTSKTGLPSRLSLYSAQQYEVFKVTTSTKGYKLTSSNSSVVKVISRTKIVGKVPGSATLTVTNTLTGQKKNIPVTVRKMKILFEGASLTGRAYDNDRRVNYPTTRYVLPNMFNALMRKQGYVLETSVAIKGYSKSFLATQLEFYNQYYSQFNKAYDVVVLNILPPVTFKERLTKNWDMQGLQKIIPLLISKNKNVRIYIRHAWSYRTSSKSKFVQDFTGINATVAALSRQFNHKIYIIHDGEAMYYASRKGLPVYSRIDDIHASLKGMYLVNYCVASAIITNVDATKLNYNGGYNGIYLSAKDAATYKSIAKLTCYQK